VRIISKHVRDALALTYYELEVPSSHLSASSSCTDCEALPTIPLFTLVDQGSDKVRCLRREVSVFAARETTLVACIS